MAVYVGGDECRVVYVARNGQQLRVSSVWVGDRQVFPPANRQEIHFFNRETQGFGRVDNGTHFAFTVPVPWWATSLDVVILGAGGKGRDGTKSFSGGSDGAGGRSGAWVVKTVALTQSTDAVVRVGKGTSTAPHATEMILPGIGGQADVRVHDGEGVRTANSGSTGGTPSPRERNEYNDLHLSSSGGSRNNPGGHPGGGGGGGQGSNLLGNPKSGQPGGDGYVWLRFRSAPALNPGDTGFAIRVGVTSGWSYTPLREWAVSIGKTYQTITEITVPMEVVGPSLDSLFYYCQALNTIPAMDTSQVTDMNSMFWGCSSLASVPELNTSQVTDMNSMFRGCSSLASVPELNTSQVTDMNSMFRGCSSLASVPDLDTSSATNMAYLLAGCSSLTSVPELNTSQVTDMYAMFNYCHALTTIPALSTSQVTNMGAMFYGCTSLTTIPPMDTSQLTNTRHMFYDCSALTSVPELNTSQVPNMEYMFYNCHALTTIPPMDTSQVTDMNSMFWGCSSLTTIPALDAIQVTDVGSMFLNCSSLESVTLPGMGNAFTTKRTLDMKATKLNASAANALMQSLGTPAPGGTLQLPATAAGANTSIAASKNWTVTIG